MKKWLLVGALAIALAGASLVAFRSWRALGRAQRTADAASEAPRKPEPLEFVETAYDGELAKGWQDWGWGPHELGDGPAKIAFAAYGGFILRHDELPSRFGGLSFRYQVPASWPDFLAVRLLHAGTGEEKYPLVAVSRRHVANLKDGWREALIDWNELNPSGSPFDRIMISARVDVPAGWALLDKIGLTAQGRRASATPSNEPRSADLSILCSEPAHWIDPLIYGMTFGVWETGAPANRIGGNPLTRLNWDLGDTWNVGSDWYFENHRQKTKLPRWIDDATERGVKTALVVPTIGWVAKDASSFAFPRSKFGAQRAHDPHRPEAGDGFRPDGKPIEPGPPTETSVAAPPETIGRWVRTLRELDGAGATRDVAMYILDNEPALWDVTHRDVHPEPVGYDELLDRTIRYATAIREAHAEGVIAGPAEWGWTNYFDSAKDRNAKVKLDRLAHGNVDLVPWYLKKLHEHEKKTGTRLLNVLDLHYYPQAERIFGGNARTDPTGAALRIRSTRALWDPDYVDESWIADRVRLIPRMKEWVRENYPGLKVSIGEWSFGADEHISGALATIEALGRFGEHGLNSAFYWGGPKSDSKTFWAFRAFRNFDGKGGRFLDWSLRTRKAELVSLFASRDEGKKRIVAIIANMDAERPVTARIRLDGCGPARGRRAFVYGPDSKELTEEKIVPGEAASLNETLAPFSFKIVELILDPSEGKPATNP